MVGDEAISVRQRRVQQIGAQLEGNVQSAINSILNAKDIYAHKPSEINRMARTDDQLRGLLVYCMMPLPHPCGGDFQLQLPDTDLIVALRQVLPNGLHEWKPLTIVSCKASFHARETEATFWSRLNRERSVRNVLVTEDSDRYQARGPKTELKSCGPQASKTRRLLEAYMDRVYIIKKYSVAGYDLAQDINRFRPAFQRAEAQHYTGIGSHIFDDIERRPHGEYCSRVRPFDDLLFDLMRWKYEALG